MKKHDSKERKFMNVEVIGARLLFLATVLALLFSNSSFEATYFHFLNATHALFWINDGLMTIFFLVVGLEIKHELLQGALNSPRKAALPAIAAFGGMLAPALIYAALNYHDATLLRGWAVPTATDIAFSLSVLSLLGSRIPFALKSFLMTLAILDDLAAITIIAVFYTETIHLPFLIVSFLGMIALFILNRWKITKILPYLLIGIFIWVSLLKSGVHPTLAGIAVAFSIPLQDGKKSERFPALRLQTQLHPWVALLIIPLFAFANAGVSFLHIAHEGLQFSIIWGVVLGLFFGKQLGIFTASWLAVKRRWAALPREVRFSQLYAASILCGIGFTISLFIGSLAFSDFEHYFNSLKMAVLLGSVLSGITGYLLLLFVSRK